MAEAARELQEAADALVATRAAEVDALRRRAVALDANVRRLQGALPGLDPSRIDKVLRAYRDVLGDKAFEKFGKWFSSFHSFLFEKLAGSYKKVVTFKFVQPDAQMQATCLRQRDRLLLCHVILIWLDVISSAPIACCLKLMQLEQMLLKRTSGQEGVQRKKAEKKKLMEDIKNLSYLDFHYALN